MLSPANILLVLDCILQDSFQQQLPLLEAGVLPFLPDSITLCSQTMMTVR